MPMLQNSSQYSSHKLKLKREIKIKIYLDNLGHENTHYGCFFISRY
jgi:hypothetical protein